MAIPAPDAYSGRERAEGEVGGKSLTRSKPLTNSLAKSGLESVYQRNTNVKKNVRQHGHVRTYNDK